MSDEKTEVPCLHYKIYSFFDEDSDCFVMQSKNSKDHVNWEISISPENFNVLTARMIRILKDFNLREIKIYKERMENEKAKASVVDGEENFLANESSSE